MLFRKGNIRKVVSATMLLMLLLIHSVKLLHSHPVILHNSSSKNVVSDLNDHAEKSASSDCNICSYQLARDADEAGEPVFESPTLAQSIFVEQLFSSYNDPFSAELNGRGPPRL